MRHVHRAAPARTASILALSLLAFTLSPGAQAALPREAPEPTTTTSPAPAPEPAVTAVPDDGDPVDTVVPPVPDPSSAPVPTAEPSAAPAPTAEPSPAPAPVPAPAPSGSGVEPDAQWVVLYAEGTDVDAEADALRADGTVVEQTFSDAAPAAVVTLTASEAAALGATDGVESVEPDSVVAAFDVQPNAPWGLDRSDQRALPLSGTYSAPSTAAGVTVYVVDTGVTAGNVDFGGRVTAGWTAIADGGGTADCNGHGTHIAGTIAGTTYGVAKRATIVPVRVLGCDGKGTLSDLLAGIDWITAQHAPGVPAVANLSLGGVTSYALDTALQTMIQDGVTAVVAAGNDSVDACSVSPARVPQAVTVAATDSADRQAYFTNVGACVDLYAPGVSIVSAGHLSSTATAVKSGTSTAAPHVSGAAALILADTPAATPAQVADALVGRATGGVVSGATGGTPNRLLFVNLGAGAADGVNSAPIGAIDVATAVGTDSIAVHGWALDPDTTAPIAVHVYVDSASTSVLADGHRPDVASAYGRGAAHGFATTMPAAPGTHQVCVYAINATAGVNPLLGCRTVTVVNAAPIGMIELATASGPDSISVYGWALDPDTSASIPVHVYVDSASTSVLANGNRPDVDAAYRRGAAHGFAATMPASPGAHQVCVYAINATAGVNPLLGCRTVTVVNAAPIGIIDAAYSAGPAGITVSGWALDPDTTASIPVHVYVDGASTSVLADGDRPDVASGYGRGAAHGFSTTMPAGPGSHQVCVYAINATAGVNPLLGCRTVVV